MKKEVDILAPIPAAEVRAACDLVLASRMFVKAPRMSQLLRFLIDKAVGGTVLDTSEYAIGIEFFGRTASAYSTSEDPIVRVQVGRLREKLRAYYAIPGVRPDIEIAIPKGSYMPVIRRINMPASRFKQGRMLAIHPFKCISQHEQGGHFTQGLYEELIHQSFRVFGRVVVSHAFLDSGRTDSGAARMDCRAAADHRMEGSVQIDAERIKVSVRLIDVSAGCLAWSEQFDRKMHFAIAIQEELAVSICSALKRYFRLE